MVIRSRAGEDQDEVQIHKLIKYQRSNQEHLQSNPSFAGVHVKKGQIIADGPATELENSLGQNVEVAFMSWWL
jgi:DNA-directed RNA polymerase beta subunit